MPIFEDVEFSEYLKKLPKVGEDALSEGNDVPVNTPDRLSVFGAKLLAKQSELEKKSNIGHEHLSSDIVDFADSVFVVSVQRFTVGSVTGKDLIDCLNRPFTPVLQDDNDAVTNYYHLSSLTEDEDGFVNLRFETTENKIVRVLKTRFSSRNYQKVLSFERYEMAVQEDLHEVRVSDSEYEELEEKGEIDPTARYIIVEDD